VIQKGQGRDHNMLSAQYMYLENSEIL